MNILGVKADELLGLSKEGASELISKKLQQKEAQPPTAAQLRLLQVSNSHVIGTPGRSAWLLNSVAKAVTKHASKPTPAPRTMRKMMLPQSAPMQLMKQTTIPRTFALADAAAALLLLRDSCTVSLQRNNRLHGSSQLGHGNLRSIPSEWRHGTCNCMGVS